MAGKGSSISRMAMKAMGLFGGVQIAGILCSIIRTKLVAMWIGPVGVGLFGLFNNALEMISTGTNLGIRSSSVRDISQALTGRNPELVSRMVTVVRKWSMWLGLAGALVTLTLAPLLSQLTFGDSTHIWGFVALSVAVLLQALTNGEYAILQGTARLKRLASVTLWEPSWAWLCPYRCSTGCVSAVSCRRFSPMPQRWPCSPGSSATVTTQRWR